MKPKLPKDKPAAIEAILKAKSRWMDRIMRKCCPKDVVDRATGGRTKSIVKAADWIKEHGFMLKEHPDRSDLTLNDTVLSQFSIRFDNNSPVAMERDNPQLEKIVEDLK